MGVNLTKEEDGRSRNPDWRIRTQIGSIQGKRLRFLAHVEQCKGEDCPLYEHCQYVPQGRCSIIYQFLRGLYIDWTDPKHGLGDVLSQVQLDRIGTHLMPLYHQLARFSLEASTLNNTTYSTKTGDVRAYPHFKEIRDVLREIRAEMKDLKLDDMWQKKFPSRSAPAAFDLDDIMQQGRLGAYEAMEQRARAIDKVDNEGYGEDDADAS